MRKAMIGAVLAALALMGCGGGGGGGGGGTPTLTPARCDEPGSPSGANLEIQSGLAAREVISYVFDVAPVETIAYTQAKLWMINSPPAVGPRSGPCTDSVGTGATNRSDSDGDPSDLDLDETIQLTLTGCKAGGRILDGNLKMTVRSFEGTPKGARPWKAEMCLDFTDLRLDGNRTGNGKVIVQIEAPAGRADFIGNVRGPSFTLETSNSRRSIQNFRLDYVEPELDGRGQPTTGAPFQFGGNGAVTVNNLGVGGGTSGTITFATSANFVGIYRDPPLPPEQGQIRIDGAPGVAPGNVTMRAATAAFVDLDLGSDGFEEVNVPWDEVLP